MANVKISDLTPASAGSGTQQFEINDGGVSKRLTAAQLEAYVLSQLSSGDVSGAGGALSANNLSDLANAATARTNLGVAIGTNVQAYSATLTSWAGKTVPAGAAVGTTDTQTLTNKTLTKPIISGSVTETVYALSGTTPALEPDNGSIQTWTLTGNSTPTDGLAAGESLTLMIDDGAAYTITWPSVTWRNNGGTAPTLATSGYTVVTLWKVSTTLYGALVGDGS